MRKMGRAVGYLLIGGVTGVVALVSLVVLGFAAVTSLVGLGLPLLAGALDAERGFLNTERRRLGRHLGVTIAAPAHEPAGSLLRRLAAAARRPATWRDGLWLTIHAVFGPALACGTGLLTLVALGSWFAALGWWALPSFEFSFLVPIDSWARAPIPLAIAVVGTAAVIWLLPLLARAHARLGRSLLEPTAADRLTERVEELSVTRAAALDAHAAELRRIERDLHDGIQARLVSVGIQLGVSQRRRDITGDDADELVDRARTGVEETLAELQAVVRGIYPPILADRGLDGALHALAADSPIPLDLTVTDVGRLPAAVEAAAYHVAAEAVTNIAKHSRADHASLRVHLRDQTVTIEVTDDGRGGADEADGTGLAGIRHRTAALDGRYRLSSPPDGPTTLTVELPCGS